MFYKYLAHTLILVPASRQSPYLTLHVHVVFHVQYLLAAALPLAVAIDDMSGAGANVLPLRISREYLLRNEFSYDFV